MTLAVWRFCTQNLMLRGLALASARTSTLVAVAFSRQMHAFRVVRTERWSRFSCTVHKAVSHVRISWLLTVNNEHDYSLSHLAQINRRQLWSHTVAIGSSPPLAYCIIFVVISDEGMIYIFAYVFVTVTVLCLCAHALLPQPAPHWLAANSPSQFHLFAVMWLSHVTTAVCEWWVWILFTSQVRRCWTKINSAANFGEKLSSVFMQCVGCEWYDRQRLWVALWHCQELSNKQYAQHSQCKFWVLRQLTPAISSCPPPFLRRQQSVPWVLSTKHCAPTCEPLATATSYYCWWHSRSLYYVKNGAVIKSKQTSTSSVVGPPCHMPHARRHAPGQTSALGTFIYKLLL